MNKPLLLCKLQSVNLLGEQKFTMKCEHKLGVHNVCEIGVELFAATSTTYCNADIKLDSKTFVRKP